MNTGAQAKREAQALERIDSAMQQLATARKIEMPEQGRAGRDPNIKRLFLAERVADFLDALLASEIKAVNTEEKIVIEEEIPVKEAEGGREAKQNDTGRSQAEGKPRQATAPEASIVKRSAKE